MLFPCTCDGKILSMQTGMRSVGSALGLTDLISRTATALSFVFIVVPYLRDSYLTSLLLSYF